MREAVEPIAMGAFGAAGAVLAQHGTSGLAIGLAIIGAVLAAREVDPFRWRDALAVLVFNAIVGVVGGSILAAFLASGGWLVHPLALSGLSFAVAYVGNDAVQGIKPVMIASLIRIMGGKGK